MAELGRSGNKASKPLTNTLQKPAGTNGKGNRRKLSLVIIAFVLNVLLWSSFICIAASLYQIISNPMDASSYAQVALTETSALATIGYTFFHTILSIKQRLWEQQQRHTFAIKRTSSVPARVVASLCVLWLLTSGWNMILVAKRPVCLQKAPGLQSWEYGLTCSINRVGMTFAAISLGASITLLGILAKVSRPFEAHLFSHGYQPSIEVCWNSYTPDLSQSDIGSSHFQKHLVSQQRLRSLHETDVSNLSNVYVDENIPDNSLPNSATSGPFTVQSPGTGVFTSHHAPPPIPAAYVAPRRNSLPGIFPLASQPPKSQTSPNGSWRSSESGGNARQSLPAHFSTSTWHAVHPNPESLALVTRSRSDLPNARFSYQNPYSRSSISLTRPQRLSYASAAPSLSSRTEHTDSGSQDDFSSRANSSEIARAIAKAIPIPMATHPSNLNGHIRLMTALDTTSDAQQSYHIPHLTTPSTPQHNHVGLDDEYDTLETRRQDAETPSDSHRKYIRSTSPGFLSLFSPDSSPTDDKPHPSPLKEVSANRIPRKPVPPPREPSEAASTPNKLLAAEAARAMLSNMPDDLSIPDHARPLNRPPRPLPRAKAAHVSNKTGVYEQIKNKPLPRIAFL